MKHLLLLLSLPTATLHAEGGSLTPPPGSPAPTMKSLDQIEARTPLVEGATGVSVTPGSGNITINESGSYYLAGNLTVTNGNAITILSDLVTLDLNGFTITTNSDPASGNGIFILGSDVTITNGNISGSYDVQEETGTGFGTGIKSTEDGPIEIYRVKISNCSQDGINIGNDFDKINSVTACLVRNVGNIGIVASTVEKSVVSNSREGGILCDTASHCKVTTIQGNGIEGTLVSHCRAYTGSGHGLHGDNVTSSVGTCTHGIGVYGEVISHTIGRSSQHTGMRALRLVSFSRGQFGGDIMNGHFEIIAPAGIGCADGLHLITNEFLMP